MAANWSNFDNQTRTMMKSASFLLALQRLPKMKSPITSKWTLGKVKEQVAEEDQVEWVLCKATDVSCFVGSTSKAGLIGSGDFDR